MSTAWLWSPSEDQLLTTRFMRNRALFENLACDLLPELRAQRRRPLRVLVWACSTGAEVYTLRLLCPPDLVAEVWGADVNPTALDEAARGVYASEAFHSLLDGERSLLTAAEVEALFERWTGAEGATRFGVRAEHRRGVRFVVADLFAPPVDVPEAEFDLVLCNNLLLHLQPDAALAAIGRLRRYVRGDGALVLAGCQPAVRARAVAVHGLRPWTTALEAIAAGWDGVSAAWDLSPRPVWAWPTPSPADPDYVGKRCEVFTVAPLPDPDGKSPVRGPRRRDEATLWLFDREPRCLSLRTLEELFADLVFRADPDTVPALYQDNYYPIYEALARYLEPRSILEIGTRFCYSLVPLTRGALAAGAKSLKVVSIDLESYANAFPCSSQEVARRNFEACIGPLCHDREVEVDFVVGDSHTVVLPSDWSFDLVHVDGDHSEDGACRDIVAAFARLRPGGVVLVDDLDQPAVFAGYRRAVATLGLPPGERAFVAHKHGLGLLRRTR